MYNKLSKQNINNNKIQIHSIIVPIFVSVNNPINAKANNVFSIRLVSDSTPSLIIELIV